MTKFEKGLILPTQGEIRPFFHFQRRTGRLSLRLHFPLLLIHVFIRPAGDVIEVSVRTWREDGDAAGYGEVSLRGPVSPPVIGLGLFFSSAASDSPL